MNAPWSLANKNASNREPFMAFVCDDATIEALKPLMGELNWASEKLFKGGVRNGIQSLSVSASPQILLVDLSEAENPLGDINSLAEVCEQGTIVLTIGRINDVTFYRELLASGIHDYLLKPVTTEMLRETFLLAQATLHAPRPVVDDENRQKYIAAVVGARGGVGVSMVASSIAQLVSKERKLKTALLDLDIQFGIGALSFDLEPGRGMTDALENPNRIDSLLLERAMVRDHDDLAILSAEAPINAPLLTEPTAFLHLVAELASSFDAVVIDLPRHLAVQNPQILSDSTHVYLVTDLTLAGTRDTIRMLAFLKTHAPNADIVVVANKVGAATELEVSRKDFEISIERPIQVVIPQDSKTAIDAAKQGRPFVEIAKSGKAGAALRELSGRIGAGADVAGHGKPKSRLVAKIQALTSKMTRKK
jgi:pilus assembly protein CpaE